MKYDDDNEEDFFKDLHDMKSYKHKKTIKNIRSDHWWAFLLDSENVPNLRKLVEFVFAIPASNSYCESIFIHMKYLCNSNRNCMKHDLVAAELKIKMNTHFTCREFYDYLLSQPDLLKQIRSSDKYSHIAKVPYIVWQQFIIYFYTLYTVIWKSTDSRFCLSIFFLNILITI